MKTKHKPKVSLHAVALAEQATDRANRKHGREATIVEVRREAWESRFRDVTAGRDGMATLWLEALAHLGDKGAIRAVEDAAALATEAEQDAAWLQAVSA